MSSKPQNEYQPYLLDKNRVQAAFDHAAHSYDEAAVLQHEIGHRVMERLEMIKIQPEVIVDIGSGTGRLSSALTERYPDSQLYSLDLAPGMLTYARKQSIAQPQGFVCADTEQLPLSDQSVDMIISNVTLQWCSDLERALRECQRVIKPGGLLMFTTFGPDTLKELRISWSGVDNHNHVNAFFDMHDIGDALRRIGLSDPVMDVENFTLTYQDATTLMRDLKAVGAHNVTAGRPHGLTGKQRLQKVIKAYERFRLDDGLLPATYEVIYGHAWAPQPRNVDDMGELLDDGSVAIPLKRMRQRLGIKKIDQ